MENVKDNPQHNAAYQFGFIQAMKLQLQKLIDLTGSEKDPATGGHYVVITSTLMNYANGMPTVIECGKFRLDITTNEKATIVFDWLEDKKKEMLDLLNS